MFQRVFVCYFIIIISWVIVACTPVNLPNIDRFAITGPILKMPRTTRSALTLMVTQPVASPGYQTAAMIYTVQPYLLQAFSRNRWIAPPAQMLLPLIVGRLRQQGYYKAVVSAPFIGVTNIRLDTQLLVLRQEFFHKSSRVRLVMQAVLLSNRNNRVIASRRFSVVVPSSRNNPYGGVLAANKAAAMISTKIARFCVRRSH